MERTRTTEHTNSRSKQRSKEQSSSSQSRPNVRIKIPNIHNSSGNNKRKKRRREKTSEQVCMCRLLSPNPKFTNKGTIRGFRLLDLLPPPTLKSKAAMAVPRGSRSGGVSPFSPRLLAEMEAGQDGEQTEGPIWSDPRRIYLAALAGRVQTETRHA